MCLRAYNSEYVIIEMDGYQHGSLGNTFVSRR